MTERHDRQLQGRAAEPMWAGLRVTGPKAHDFLHRMLSNSVADLTADRARAAFLLEPTGRIVSGAVALADGDDVILWSPGNRWRDAMHAGLNKYRIADPVDFVPLDDTMWLWLAPPSTHLAATAYGVVRNSDGVGIRIPVTGLAEMAWWGPPPPQLATVPAATVDAERIAAGIPAFDRELTTTVIPIEAGVYDGLSHTKGCYVGQEVIERMWSRGRTAKRLTCFAHIAGPTAAAPLELVAPTKGRLTSIADHPEYGRIALGYVAGEPTTQVADEVGGTWQVRQGPSASARITAAAMAANAKGPTAT